jgi:hypothetical protein
LFGRKTKYVLVIAAVNFLAVLVGAAAATFPSINVQPASASNTCTHYSYPYFTGDPSTQPGSCYQYATDSYYTWSTNGFAIRDSNIVSYRDAAHNWELWYEDSVGHVYSQQVGNSAYGSIGSSNGQSRKALCYIDDSSFPSFYCTTLYNS